MLEIPINNFNWRYCVGILNTLYILTFPVNRNFTFCIEKHKRVCFPHALFVTWANEIPARI